jgi:hypothetical protein
MSNRRSEPTVRRLLTTLAVSAVVCAFAGGAPAVAAENGRTMTISPLSGPPSTIVSVAGDGCTTTLVKVSASYEGPYGLRTEADATVDGAGTWSIALSLPGPPLPGAVIPIRALCVQAVATGQVIFGYAEAQFTVTDDAGQIPAISVAPPGGPLGTTVDVSGEGCTTTDGRVWVLLREPPLSPVTTNTPVLGSVVVPVGADGRWTATFTVTDAFARGTDPLGDRVVTAECDEFAAIGAYLTAFTYPGVSFTVTLAALPVAPVAQARPGELSFTG